MYSFYLVFIYIVDRKSQFYTIPYSYEVSFRNLWHGLNEYETNRFVIFYCEIRDVRFLSWFCVLMFSTIQQMFTSFNSSGRL